ncbi:BlaI/MecI/CopY family transcriptional regulator [Hymenobacter perfusus]|jgi:BlaI family penicillinase repressor|uniref:BlaI/MecI/CopY family transcriptional regulator n=1 Tax=Hymenobacter perfusus TaxID=1236770 RepID=A0A3R9MKJ1_9BACT|nr:BlaI/MecI/CopY family transcriptional regulator [Hymenobacter perfusus]RSK42625.1 BlaI/MecI/CopY family transcriptional regulator [Hymenobacter perfusus]
MERLTQPEEEAMRGFWQLGGGFIKEVLELLPEPRPPYTTLASTVRNLERKHYLTSRKLGNTFRFVPSVTAEEYRRRFLGTFVGDYFRNSYKELVSFFAQEQKISPEELQDIIDMIENRKTRP